MKLVRERGRYMQEAVPAGEGAMAAILGLPPAEVAEICKKAADDEVVSPANLNSPEQTVISGSAAAVKRAVEIASQSGAKRAVMLPVSAPFHCALMMPAQQRLEPDLRAANFHALRFPLITNVDAEAITTGDEAREALIRQVTLPVRWLDSDSRDDRSGRHDFRRGRARAKCSAACCARSIAPFVLQRRRCSEPGSHARENRASRAREAAEG